MKLDAVRFNETARAGGGVKFGHCFVRGVMPETPNSTRNFVLLLLCLEFRRLRIGGAVATKNAIKVDMRDGALTIQFGLDSRADCREGI